LNLQEGDRWELHRQISPGALQLDSTDLEKILPIDRERMLIDRVISLRPGVYAIAEKAVSAGPKEQQFRGREQFSFPSTLAFSALEQLSMVVLLAEFPSSSVTEFPSLFAIDSIEVCAEMMEPGVLHVHARSEGDIDDLEIGADNCCSFVGEVTVNGENFVTASWKMKKGKP